MMDHWKMGAVGNAMGLKVVLVYFPDIQLLDKWRGNLHTFPEQLFNLLRLHPKHDTMVLPSCGKLENRHDDKKDILGLGKRLTPAPIKISTAELQTNIIPHPLKFVSCEWGDCLENTSATIIEKKIN